MALYHKHRPQSFESVVGQEHIVQTLKNQILLGKPAHAYLLYGPRGVGKTTTARILAKALNCPQREANSPEPCGACESCANITASRSIDVMEMDAASHTGVDNVREEIIENARFQPTASKYKIFIIDEVHMLSTASFNALLKTLEEPPEHVIFILATTELQKLPETIISRCQRFHFKKIPAPVMQAHLETVTRQEGVTLDPIVLAHIIRKSEGCARDAISLLDQLIAIGEKHITENIASIVMPTSSHEEIVILVGALLRKDLSAYLSAIEGVIARGGHIPQLASDLVESIRNILMKKIGSHGYGASLDMSQTDEETLLAQGKEISEEQLISLLDLLMKRRLDIKSSPLPQIPLEIAGLEWCLTKNVTLVPTLPVQEKPVTPPTPPPSEKKLESSLLIEPPKEAPKNIIERVKEFVAPQSDISLEVAQGAWAACIAKVESTSPSLASILRSAVLAGSKQGTIEILVPYTFHRDQLESRTTRRNLEQYLSEAAGSAVTLAVTVQEQEKVNSEDAENVAALFGGEVVGT